MNTRSHLITFPVLFLFPARQTVGADRICIYAILIPSYCRVVNSNLALISFAYHYFLAHPLTNYLRRNNITSRRSPSPSPIQITSWGGFETLVGFDLYYSPNWMWSHQALFTSHDTDTSARHQSTLTFVVMHNNKLMSGKFIQTHVYSYSSQRHCLYLPEGKNVSPRSDWTSWRPDIYIGEVKPPSVR